MTHNTTQPEMTQAPHEYGPSRVGHGFAQCKWCYGTASENAVIAPNHCDQRAIKDTAWNTRTEQSASPSGLVEAATKARDYLRDGVPAEYSPDNVFLPLDAALAAPATADARSVPPDYAQWARDMHSPATADDATPSLPNDDVRELLREAFEALSQVELLSTNHGAWFENDAWGWGQMMGNAARGNKLIPRIDAALSAQPAPGMVEAHNAALELAAFAADAKAELHRHSGIAGNFDPMEAELLDQHFTEFAKGLRNSKRASTPVAPADGEGA